MKADIQFKNNFYQKLNQSKNFWKLYDIEFENYVDKKVVEDIIKSANHPDKVKVIEDVDAITDLMCFLPPKEEVNKKTNNLDKASFPFIRVFKHRTSFINSLYDYIKDFEEKIAVLTLDRYGVDDSGIRSNGAFMHPIEMLKNFQPKTYKHNQHIPVWPWVNFGTAFFIAPDLSWAIYTTSISDESLLVLISDSSVINTFLQNTSSILNDMYMKQLKVKKNEYNYKNINFKETTAYRSFTSSIGFERFEASIIPTSFEFHKKIYSNDVESTLFHFEIYICKCGHVIRRLVADESYYSEKIICTKCQNTKYTNNLLYWNSHEEESFPYLIIPSIEIENKHATYKNPQGFMVKIIWRAYEVKWKKASSKGIVLFEEAIKVDKKKKIVVTENGKRRNYLFQNINNTDDSILKNILINHFLGTSKDGVIKSNEYDNYYEPILCRLRNLFQIPSLVDNVDLQWFLLHEESKICNMLRLKKPKTILDIFNILMGKHANNKLVRKYIFSLVDEVKKEYKASSRYYDDYDAPLMSGFENIYLKCQVKDPNVAIAILRTNIDLSRFYNFYSDLVYLFGEKRIANFLIKMDERKNYYTLKDIIEIGQSLSLFINLKEDLYNIKLNSNELLNRLYLLAEIYNEKNSNSLKYFYNYSKEHYKKEEIISGLKFKLPRNKIELGKWGVILHNCLSGYMENISDYSYIVGVYINNQLTYALHIQDKRLIEARGDNNKVVKEKHMSIIHKWEKRHDITS